MFNVNGTSIEITRGDTGIFTITFTGDDAPEDGSIALVSLKKSPNSDIIWEKRLVVNNSVITVILSGADSDRQFGQYWWDVRILFRDGTVYTPMKPASFKVLEVIGNAG